jgi:hypothetical protein
MAGDSLVAGGRRWTRSVTIDVPPERVWPWLVQVGVDKGGFYTFDWAENLFGDPIHNADRIHPEWQHLRPGDAVWPSPKGIRGSPKSWPHRGCWCCRATVATGAGRRACNPFPEAAHGW